LVRSGLAYFALTVAAGCAIDTAPPDAGQTASTDRAARQTKKGAEMVDIFDRAVTDSGKPYLDAEAQLVSAGAAATGTLNANLGNPDVVARLVSRTLLAWIGGKGTQFRAALDYLESLPRHLARTPIGNPSPVGVVSYLDLHFGAELVDLLALRLLKEPDWPDWKRNSALLYLRNHPSASLTEPLIRFVSLTTKAQAADLAVEAISAANDKDLQAKLRAEDVWLRTQKGALPPKLRALVLKP
jgi:hypothetical protein